MKHILSIKNFYGFSVFINSLIFFSFFSSFYYLYKKKYYSLIANFLFFILCFYYVPKFPDNYKNLISLCLFAHFLYILFNIFHTYTNKFKVKFNIILSLLLISFFESNCKIVYSQSAFCLFFVILFIYHLYEESIFHFFMTFIDQNYVNFGKIIVKIYFYIFNLFILFFVTYLLSFSLKEFFNNFWNMCFSNELAFKLIKIFISISFLPFFFKFINKISSKFVYSLELTNVDRVQTLRDFVNIILKCFYFFASIIFVNGGFDGFGIVLTPIAFSFLAFKDLVFGFINALFILIEDSVNIGEFIEVAGVSGKVEEISLRYIKLRDFEGSIFIVPFYKIETIKNRGKDFVYVMLRVNVQLDTDSNRVIFLMKEAFNLLKKRAEYAHLRHNLLDNIEVVGLTDISNGMMFESRIKIRPHNTRFIKANYYKILKELLDEANIKFGYEYMYITDLNKKIEK